MVATELILGMEEMVNYIRDLEEENKKLEEENKKLEEENKKLKQPMVEDLEEYLEMNGAEGGVIKTQHERDFYKSKVNDLQKEVSRHRLMAGHLDEENKKLEEEKQKYQPKGSQIDPEGLHDYMKEEIDRLKEDLDDKEHWQQTMVSYMDDGGHWCNFDRWFGENIDEDDKKQEWVKIWMENTEFDDCVFDSSDDEKPDSP